MKIAAGLLFDPDLELQSLHFPPKLAISRTFQNFFSQALKPEVTVQFCFEEENEVDWGCDELIDEVGTYEKAISLLRIKKKKIPSSSHPPTRIYLYNHIDI